MVETDITARMICKIQQLTVIKIENSVAMQWVPFLTSKNRENTRTTSSPLSLERMETLRCNVGGKGPTLRREFFRKGA